MKKSKKTKRRYHKKRPLWHWVIFYSLIAIVSFSLLYYSGILGIGGPTNNINNSQEIQIFE